MKVFVKIGLTIIFIELLLVLSGCAGRSSYSTGYEHKTYSSKTWRR